MKSRTVRVTCKGSPNPAPASATTGSEIERAICEAVSTCSVKVSSGSVVFRTITTRTSVENVQRKLGGEESNSENKLSAVNHRRVGPCRVSSASLRLSLSRSGRRAPDLSTIVLPHCAAGDVDDGADLSGRDVASLIHEKKMVKAQLLSRKACLNRIFRNIANHLECS